MDTSTHPEIIGLDVSHDWLGILCLCDGRQLRLPNTDDGHSESEETAADRTALVCFEATGGCEWWLWSNLEAAGCRRGSSLRRKSRHSGEAGEPWPRRTADQCRIDRTLHGVPSGSRSPLTARNADDRRRVLRQVLYQAALVTLNRNADLKVFADWLRMGGKPHKVVVTAVARKLIVIVNTLCKSSGLGRRKPNHRSSAIACRGHADP